MGGDGWAYDIGFGGLDHVLSTGRDVSLLVLDTEIYSNTGGQASKSTPLGAVAKFAAAGKTRDKKDLGLMAMTYGHVYVAQVAWGARDAQTVQALLEAESYRGPSLVIGYSHCVGHGYDLSYGRDQQTLAVESGRWPLYRFDPRRKAEGLNPLQLDSREPWASFHDFAEKEIRFRMLERLDPTRARELFAEADKAARRHYRLYQKLAELELDGAEPPAAGTPGQSGSSGPTCPRRGRAGLHPGGGRSPGHRRHARKPGTAALAQVAEEARREVGHGTSTTRGGSDMDLSTRYLGFTLPHPLVPGASPFGWHLDSIKRLEEAGAPLIQLPSLFEEQIANEHFRQIQDVDANEERYLESVTYFPRQDEYRRAASERYLEHVQRVKDAVSVPVVASLNGTSMGGWVEFSGYLEEAGADALELNVYFVSADLDEACGSVEQRVVDITREIRATCASRSR